MAEPVPGNEQIMQAVIAQLGTLTIPGLVIEQDENPDFAASRFVHVSQGAESNFDLDQFGTQHTRVLLDIPIIVGVGSLAVGERLRTVINGMLAEVKRVLQIDHTLGGLCFLRWLSNSPGEPTDAEGLPRQNVVTMEWQADFTHAYGDPYTIFPT